MCWCAQNARTYPFGPQKGALCVSCIGQDPGAFVELPPEALSFLRHHAPSCTAGLAPPTSIKTRVQTTDGPLSDAAVVPCVICQGGANTIDHWLSYCPVVHIAWAALHKANLPPINWRQTPTKHIGIALTYLLFHLRRIVTEYGGLRPNITCVKVKPISLHTPWTCGSVRTNRSQPPSLPGFEHRRLRPISIVLLPRSYVSNDSLQHSWNPPYSPTRVSVPPRPLKNMKR